MPTPQPGEVIFYTDCRPPLQAGDYVLEVGHELLVGSSRVDDHGRRLPDAVPHPFSVVGPRFTLDPSELHAVYPPPNSQGRFASRLPMVVLRRRTLPWERTLDGSLAGPGSAAAPWLAVLLFEDNEVQLLDPPQCTIGFCVEGSPTENVRRINLPNPPADKNQPCLGIQVALTTFKDIAPMESELALLTHVRQVNTDDKELLGMDEDGWFAVVIGNRIPEPGKTYVACLASLEGCRDFLPSPSETEELTSADLNPPPVIGPGEGLVAVPAARYSSGIRFDDSQRVYVYEPIESIRLISLVRWSFTCEGGGDFESVMRALPRNGGVAMLGMTQQDATQPGVEPNVAYRVALDSGHVPIAYTTRQGEQAIAWYRGPFVPAGVERDPTGPYHTADQARRVDPLTGFENLGYAAAFEIGRLLALSDPRFALELLHWRRDGHRRVASALAHVNLAARLPDLVRDLDYTRLAHYPLAMSERLINDIGPRIREQLLGPLTDPTGLDAIRAKMPGLDATQIAQATQFEQGIITGILDGSLTGSSGTLDTLNIRDQIVLRGDFNALVKNAATEFGHLGVTRGRIL